MFRHLIIFCTIGVLCGCSNSPTFSHTAAQLWQDSAYDSEVRVPSAEEIFALTPEMSRITNRLQFGDHAALAQYLRQDGQLQYDSRLTTTAAETFAVGSGNCMSLVVMTAALAKANGVSVRYQLVQAPPIWDRQGGLYLVNGHVNIRLISGFAGDRVLLGGGSTVVDFLPGNQIRGYQVTTLSEQQLLARYYNNLAAEAIVEQRYNQAYALLKAAYRTEPTYIQLWNTLGVLYRRSDMEVMAEQVYRYAAELPQANDDALHNLAVLLERQGRLQEWQQVHARLELRRIRNPYYYYDMGEIAYQRGEYQNAVRYYERALDLADYRHEFHFGLSRAYFRNGQQRLSERHLQKAEELAPQNEKQRYQLKLAALRSS